MENDDSVWYYIINGDDIIGSHLRTSDGREVRVESVVNEERSEPVTIYNL